MADTWTRGEKLALAGVIATFVVGIPALYFQARDSVRPTLDASVSTTATQAPPVLSDLSRGAAPATTTATPTRDLGGFGEDARHSPPPVSASAVPAVDHEQSPAATETDNLEAAVVDLHTDVGVITLRFFPSAAPLHVRNFLELAKSGFYTGTRFHRVIPPFMIQGGDPNTIAGDPSTWGTGGSKTTLRPEFNGIPHKRGILSMARSASPSSASSQFFICVKDSSFLDGQYTVFGEVKAGMDVVDQIVNAPRDPRNDRPLSPVTIRSVVIRRAS